MKLTVLDEPSLEFGTGGRHIDPRHGITTYGPADVERPTARTIRVGIVGPPPAIDGLKRWLDSCREPLDAKDSRLGHLYVPFPGFDENQGFRSTLAWDTRLQRPIRDRDLKKLADKEPSTAIRAAVDLYLAELEILDEEACDVILVARPDQLGTFPPEHADPEAPWKQGSPRHTDDFRAQLKARAMRFRCPLQIVRRQTWDPSFRAPGTESIRLQDEATRAWNIHTALYYKAGGVPWRLPRDPSDLTSCYVGVSFYRSGDETTLETSVAQVFNQRGDGVIVRGAAAKGKSNDDRQPHLTRDDARRLLNDALQRYRSEHRNTPARIVLHKTSSFTSDEISGFQGAADVANVDMLELIWLPSRDQIRLFRPATHPPLRGTLLSLDASRHVLYTRGSIPFYATYPGLYIPRPLTFRPVQTESSPEMLAQELLALTKMNWNQTQLDGRLPITLRTADRVGEILRHLDPSERPQSRYAYYM